MQSASPNFPDPTVFLLTHIGNDARNAAAVLGKAGIQTRICANVHDLREKAGEQTGALVIGEEILDQPALASLLEFLIFQPPWSDIPIVLLTAAGEIQQKTYNILDFLGTRANVTLLEKPLRAITLVSVIKTALRSRNRQYEVRNLLKSYSLAVEDAQMASAKFQAVFEQSSVFAGIMTLEGKLTEANRLSLDVCGYRVDEVLGQPFWDCGWWRGSGEVQEKIRAGAAQAAQGTPYKEILPYLWADGTKRMGAFALYPIRDDAGQVIFLHPTVVDITERHHATARAEFLGQLTQKLSVVSDPREINRIATREIGRFLGVHRCYFFQPLPDRAAMRVLPDWRRDKGPSLEGTYKLAEFGRPELWEEVPFDTVAVDDVAANLWTKEFLSNYEAVEIMAFSQTPFIHEGQWVACIAVSSDQPRHWTSEEQSLLEDSVARVWPLIERARVEGALRESEERFRAMGDNIAPLAWMANAEGWVFWYNKRWYEFTGATFESMQGDGLEKVVHPGHLPGVLSTWKDSVSSGRPWEDTFPLRGADGKYRWFLSGAFPIRDASGKVTLWFGTHSDVTELRDTQDALRQANSRLAVKASDLEAQVQQRTAKLQETVGELEAFSYSIAHDMRAPLRSLQGFANILLTDYQAKLDADGQKFLHRIARSADRMDKLIRDVLSYSRLVRAELSLERVDIEQLLAGIMDTYPMLAPDKADILLQRPFPPVLGNEAMLTQIFSNLMGNGVKFVASGVKPRLKVWAESRSEGVRLFVQDNGIGIAADQHERIFGIFQQVDRAFEGTGIGLAIVKKAIERIGGKVGVQSELNKGSTFWIDVQGAPPGEPS